MRTSLPREVRIGLLLTGILTLCSLVKRSRTSRTPLAAPNAANVGQLGRGRSAIIRSIYELLTTEFATFFSLP
jgi:hypothetical protein